MSEMVIFTRWPLTASACGQKGCFVSLAVSKPEMAEVCTPLPAEGPLATHEAALRLRLTAHLRSEELRDQQELGLRLEHSSRYAMLSVRSRLHSQEV